MWLVFKYESANDNLINHRYLSYNKNYSNKIDEKLKNWFKNTFKFSSNYINEFILFLRKGVYSREFMDYCGKFSETVFPEKKVCSNLNMEHTTDSGDNHAKRTFSNKNFGEYHDLYFTSDTLLQVHVFENFRKMCLEIYELDPENFISVSVLA